MDAQTEQAVIGAMLAVEQALDDELEKTNNLDDDDYQKIRQKRMEEMQRKAEEAKSWSFNDHGIVVEIKDQKEFFEVCKRSKKVVCEFFRPENKFCSILHEHTQVLARKHMETKFCRINANEAPFLVERFNIWMLPTLVLCVEGKVVHQVQGLDPFDDTGFAKFGTDNVEAVLFAHSIVEDTCIADEMESMREIDDDEAFSD